MSAGGQTSPVMPRPVERDHVSAAAITARIDRLPATRWAWRLTVLLSLAGIFEIYDLAQTAFLPGALVRDGILAAAGTVGSAQAVFGAATFLGLFLGALAFSSVADKYGRRNVFTGALLLYSLATLAMALQSTAAGVYAFRFIAGIGIGIELVTADAYLVELVPAGVRGKAFALAHVITYLAFPLIGILSFVLLPEHPLGLAGWRWLALIGSTGAVAIWFLRLGIPESPRWLAQVGRAAEAEAILAAIEVQAQAELGRDLPPPRPAVKEEPACGSLADIFRPPYRSRTTMLIVFNFFQTIGFFGFANWLPTLLVGQGASFVHSLLYSSLIALAYPISPVIWMLTVADRVERKWLIVAAAGGVALFGGLFALQTSPAMLIGLGVLITSCSTLMSLSYHAYQAELYPTGIRARAVGFTYSFSRLATVLTGFMIAGLFSRFGAPGVLVFISASMVAVMVVIGRFGPRTRGRTLEEIAQ